jgi:hypothetical protein
MPPRWGLQPYKIGVHKYLNDVHLVGSGFSRHFRG